MAASNFSTTQYASSDFVESCGGVLFSQATRKVCILHRRNEYILPKGRRNVGESRARAAVREVCEETGVPCRLMRVALQSRAPSAEEDTNAPEGVRTHEGVEGEPFMVTFREVGRGGMKLIWWYVLEVVDEDSGFWSRPEEQFEIEWRGLEDVRQALTFQADREIVVEALAIVAETWSRCRTE